MAINRLREKKLNPNGEDDVAGFLGGLLECNTNAGIINSMQTSLIDQIIAVLNLGDGKMKFTLALYRALLAV